MKKQDNYFWCTACDNRMKAEAVIINCTNSCEETFHCNNCCSHAIVWSNPMNEAWYRKHKKENLIELKKEKQNE